jgi:hypothetical protein
VRSLDILTHEWTIETWFSTSEQLAALHTTQTIP